MEHRNTENLSALRHSIEDLNREGTTTLLGEQNTAIALSVAGRGHVLQAGSVAPSGTVVKLSAHPDVKRACPGKGA